MILSQISFIFQLQAFNSRSQHDRLTQNFIHERILSSKLKKDVFPVDLPKFFRAPILSNTFDQPLIKVFVPRSVAYFLNNF